MKEKLYTIKVIPNSKVNKIVEQSNDFFKIKIAAPAEKNKANYALINFLAQHFKIPKNNVQLLAGEKSRVKIIKILT